MLNRRHLRIKVLQALYAHFQTDGSEIMQQEKRLVASIESIYDLYIYLLSSLIEVRDFALNRMEDARQKFLPTEAELNPNTRFVDNKFLEQLSNNRDLQKNIQRLKVSWADDQEIYRKIYLAFRDSEAYQTFMDKPTVNYREEKDIVLQLLGGFMLESDAFTSLFEEKNIHWADDIDTAVLLLAKTVKKWNEGMDEFQKLPPLMISPDEEGEDLIRDFVLKLFRRTIVYKGEFDGLIAERAQNWDIERIALLDVILLKMALTELIDFPSIPVKVTLNEYIEISKEYSTPRSRQFVNGMLDKLVADLRAQDRIKKMGRGLIE
ncbi:MAG: transcription antitermination protein NusB [Lentimicrobium sp.]|jgi:N utilization substance protein B|nr:transcription antitermination protein NusB [Lentimicrobium sp.]